MNGKRSKTEKAAGNGREKRRAGEKDFPVCSMNGSYSADRLTGKLTESWKNCLSFKEEDGSVELLTDPFQCCIMKDFISVQAATTSSDPDLAEPSSKFINGLMTELLKLKFYEKNNDLYQFHQSDDLKKFKSPCISYLRSMFRDELLPWLRHVTGLQLTDTIDMTCSKYNYTDVLLCHDDELEGRRIAFILYLVPEWLPEDGGTLDLFDTDEHGQPRVVVKSLLPTRNSFIFFDVNEKSFHQVAEVLSANKIRLSVNGWFHGPPFPRAPLHKQEPLHLAAPISLGLEVLSDWVNPEYLDVGTQAQIQQQFEADSQIQLPSFLLEEKYSILCEELRDCDQKELWTHFGPPNRKNVDILNIEVLPPNCRDFLHLVTSKPFCLLLAHMTELELVENMIKPESAANGVGRKRSDNVNKLETGPASGNSTESIAAQETTLGMKKSSSDAHSDSLELSSSALCRSDFCSWQSGNYVFAGDSSDPGLGKFCLEMVLNFNSEDWCDEFGGTINYIADDADEEFLTLSPTPNSLSLVYRDKDLLRFTKYINHRSLSISSSTFHSLSGTYLENLDKKDSL